MGINRSYPLFWALGLRRLADIRAASWGKHTAKSTAPAILLTRIELLADRAAPVRRLSSNGVSGKWAETKMHHQRNPPPLPCSFTSSPPGFPPSLRRRHRLHDRVGFRRAQADKSDQKQRRPQLCQEATE